MTSYLIQIVFFQALFLGVYHLFLKRETFFTYNRLYLILTPILSLILPFVKVAALSTVISSDTIVALLPEIVLGDPLATSAITPETQATGFQFSWQGIYLLGLFASMGIFGTKLIQCLRLFKFRKGKEHIITIPNSQEAFSFLHFIFMGDGLDALSRKQILAHEQVHVEQRHTWDLLIFELLRIVFWFNPFVYIYQRNLAIVHEYIADAKAAGAITKQQYYQDLLNMTFGTQQLSFTNTFFNHSFIKNRILMLQKSKSKTSAQCKYLLIIPMVLSMLIYVSCGNDNEDIAVTGTDKMETLYAKYADKETITQEEYAEFSGVLQQVLSFEKNGEPSDPELFVEVMNAMAEKYAEGRKAGVASTQQQSEYYDAEDIPFAVIEKIPVYPGCESNGDIKASKECMSQSIGAFVATNFNTKIGKEVGLTGKNRIFVQFKINKEGKVTNVRSRAPHPALETEAKRVIELLPQMKPGMQRGQPKSVLYSLPITFVIEK